MSVQYKKDKLDDDTEDIIPGSLASTMFKKTTASIREVGMVILVLILFIIIIALAIVLGTAPTKSQILSGYCNSPACLKGSGYIMSNINQSVNPCHNFFEYACGTWGERNPLQPGQSSNTVYSKLVERNKIKLENILISPRLVRYGSAEYKIKAFYRTCTNEYQNSKRGGKPLIDVMRNAMGFVYLLDKNSTSHEGDFDWQVSLRKLHVDYWTDALFSFRVGQNYVDTTKRIIQVDLGGLAMKWWFYADDYASNSPILQAYRNFIGNVTSLVLRDSGLKLSDAEKQSRIEEFVDDVMYFETGLANITATTPPSTNPHEYENFVALGDLTTKTGWDWTKFFQYMFNEVHITSATKIVLLEKEYLYKVSDFIRITAIDEFPNYMDKKINQYFAWRLMQTYLPHVSYEYNHLGRNFYFESTGTQNFQGTYEFCFNYASSVMSDALGSLFIKDHFSDQGKTKLHEMVDQLKASIVQRIPNLSWMDSKTTGLAQAKIKNIVDKLGYPEFMMDDKKMDQIYSSLTITKDYFQNVLNINKFQQSDLNRRLGEGVNKEEWRLNTYDVYTKFSQLWMDLIVPAGIIQVPFFHADVPMYINFGAAGSLLTHELIHAIDEYGGFFNKDGKFEDWWSTDTATKYAVQRGCIRDFYDKKSFKANGFTINVNGLFYAREGIAEIGGVRNAYYAYKDWVAKNGEEKLSPTLHLNNDQAFFVSYAQTNCYIRFDATWIGPGQFRGFVPESIRTNGAMQQLQEFQNVFKCKAEQKMNSPDKCNVF